MSLCSLFPKPPIVRAVPIYTKIQPILDLSNIQGSRENQQSHMCQHYITNPILYWAIYLYAVTTHECLFFHFWKVQWGKTNNACNVELAKIQRWQELCLASLANSSLISTWLLGEFLGCNLEHLQGWSVCDLANIFFTFRLQLFTFLQPHL